MSRTIKLCKIKKHVQNGNLEINDKVVREEPLSIIIDGSPYSILMRTPGDEEDLVLGFLYSEGVVKSPEEIDFIHYCSKEKEKNTVVVGLKKIGRASCRERV